MRGLQYVTFVLARKLLLLEVEAVANGVHISSFRFLRVVVIVSDRRTAFM